MDKPCKHVQLINMSGDTFLDIVIPNDKWLGFDYIENIVWYKTKGNKYLTFNFSDIDVNIDDEFIHDYFKSSNVFRMSIIVDEDSITAIVD
jgi:hypothetical protein